MQYEIFKNILGLYFYDSTYIYKLVRLVKVLRNFDCIYLYHYLILKLSVIRP